MKEPYICLYCDQRSTRWWNLKNHMKRKHGEYSLGRSSGQYTPNDPFWYKRNNQSHNFGPTTVTDTVGDPFQPRYVPQQKPVGTSQYSASPVYSPRQTIDDRSYGTSLPQSAIQKIQEIQRLVKKYPQYCPDHLLQWIIISCTNGDNQLLDDKLEQLRTIDRRLNGWS
jgi:hypothetical protein